MSKISLSRLSEMLFQTVILLKPSLFSSLILTMLSCSMLSSKPKLLSLYYKQKEIKSDLQSESSQSHTLMILLLYGQSLLSLTFKYILNDHTYIQATSLNIIIYFLFIIIIIITFFQVLPIKLLKYLIIVLLIIIILLMFILLLLIILIELIVLLAIILDLFILKLILNSKPQHLS